MNKLTKHYVYFDNSDGYEAIGYSTIDQRPFFPIIKRLSQYEETGLNPTDVADLRNFACQICGKYKIAHDGACDGCRWKV